MEMQQIRYFLSLSRTLNFTRAAEECNVTQPALTRAVQALEAELGGELLRRERQRTHLTELGKRLLPLMQQCYESALSAKALASSVKRSEIAPLSIAVSRTVNLALLMAPLAELSRACPGIQLKLKRGSAPEISRLLKNGEVELALAGPLGEVWDRLETWPLFSEPFALIASRHHPLAGRNEAEIGIGQLTEEQFLVQIDCEMAEELSCILATNGIVQSGAHQVETDHDLIALIGANLGIAIIPASMPHSAELRRLPVKGLDLRRAVAIYGVAGRRRPAVATKLLNLLRAADWSRYAG
jgi:DNA-binding transcriptional LysR family regulator